MVVLRKLVATAFSLGAVHVLTGPDHLSALAALSANVGNFKAFWFGVRWGIGHSLGLILVGGIFIAIDKYTRSRSHHPTPSTLTNSTETWDDETSDSSSVAIPDKASLAMDTLVGIFMILLGSYSLYRVYRQIQLGSKSSTILDPTHAHENKDPPNQQSSDTPLDPVERPNSPISTDMDIGDTTQPNISEITISAKIIPPDNRIPVDPEQPQIHLVEYSHIHNVQSSAQPEEPRSHVHSHIVSYGAWWNRKPLLAFLVGLVHGVSGPGGVLGVIPAVQVHHVSYGFLYLTIFCITSTFVMGVFATSYGTITHTISRKYPCSCGKNKRFTMAVCIELFSSFCCFFIGILWIVLVSMDKLDQFFH